MSPHTHSSPHFPLDGSARGLSLGQSCCQCPPIPASVCLALLLLFWDLDLCLFPWAWVCVLWSVPSLSLWDPLVKPSNSHSPTHEASPIMWSYHQLTSHPHSTAWISKYHSFWTSCLVPHQVRYYLELDLPSLFLYINSMSCLLDFTFLSAPVL